MFYAIESALVVLIACIGIACPMADYQRKLVCRIACCLALFVALAGVVQLFPDAAIVVVRIVGFGVGFGGVAVCLVAIVWQAVATAYGK